jgi:hypothetical protein
MRLLEQTTTPGSEDFAAVTVKAKNRWVSAVKDKNTVMRVNVDTGYLPESKPIRQLRPAVNNFIVRLTR